MSTLAKLSRASQSVYLPKTIGEIYGGGWFMGYMRGPNGQRYAIVCAGSDGEFFGSMQPNGYLPDASNGGQKSVSYWDANQNQSDQVNQPGYQYPLAVACANYRAGGFTDWVMPAYVQAVMCYRACKPNGATNVIGNGTAGGSNVYIEPAFSGYGNTDPGQSPIGVFAPGAAHDFEPNFYFTSTILPSNGGPLLVNYSQGQETWSSIITNRTLRAIRMVRVPG